MNYAILLSAFYKHVNEIPYIEKWVKLAGIALQPDFTGQQCRKFRARNLLTKNIRYPFIINAFALFLRKHF
jgi:hypothetical protein